MDIYIYKLTLCFRMSTIKAKSLTWLKILLVAFVLGQGGSLRVFDCAHRNATSFPLDLLEPQHCEPVSSFYEDGETVTVQIIQTEARREVEAFQCIIRETSIVTRCGFDSLTYGSHHPLLDSPYFITAEDCKLLALKGEFKYRGRSIINVEKSAPTTKTFFYHGFVKKDGSCETEDFVVNGISFTNSYEKRILRISVNTVKGTVDSAGFKVRFTNGLHAEYALGQLKDSSQGLMTWEVTEGACHQSISSIYLGEATIKRNKDPEKDAVLILANNSTNQYGGFLLKEKTNICGSQSLLTQVAGIAVRIIREGDAPLQHSAFKEALQQSATALLTHVHYLHIRAEANAEERFVSVYNNLCSIDRKATLLQLRLIGKDNALIPLDLYGPGHVATVAGAVAYITKCVPVQAAIREERQCTTDIPIHLKEGNRTVFADPITFIVKSTSRIYPCSPIQPVRFQIEGDWFCAQPDLRSCATPRQVDSTIQRLPDPTDLSSDLTATLYTEEQLRAHQHYMEYQFSREPILDNLASKSYSNTEDGDAGLPFSGKDFNRLAEVIGGQISPAFYYFGKYWFILWGVLVGWGLFKICVEVLVQLYITARHRGCGLWIFGALFHSTFMLLSYPLVLVSTAAKRATEPEDFPLTSAEGHIPVASNPPQYECVPMVSRDRGQPILRETRPSPQPVAGDNIDNIIYSLQN